MERGEISIAALLRSLVHLRPGDAETREALCEVLQLELARAPVPPSAVPEPEPPGERMQEAARPPPESGGNLSRLQREPDREEVPFPWAAVEPLSVQPPETQPPALEPLLSLLGRTALLSTAIATRNEGREVDLGRTVEALASGKVLSRLPRLAIPSLRLGVQVLADVGEGMLPYAGDRGELIAAIQRLVGKAQTEVLMFAGTPLRKAGRGPRSRWGQWKPPPRGTPVLLLTELGLGGPVLSHDRAPLGEWLKFCEELRHARCPIVAFVPYERRRWPAALARAMTILPWDRGTTVSMVLHAVRFGERKQP